VLLQPIVFIMQKSCVDTYGSMPGMTAYLNGSDAERRIDINNEEKS
jgi:hypothetical protein